MSKKGTVGSEPGPGQRDGEQGTDMDRQAMCAARRRSRKDLISLGETDARGSGPESRRARGRPQHRVLPREPITERGRAHLFQSSVSGG